MKIISTNLSRIKQLSYNGEEVPTGIFKKPTVEPVSIGLMNIDGDEQADLKHHGGEHKAVYAFSAGHYDRWKSLLGTDELPYGAFGENFTITDLDESQVYIGDQFRFGTALLEVSQPRVPCFKLGIALNNKKAPGWFTESYSTGIYFRVLEPGQAQTGDLVSRVKKSDHGISVRELFQSRYDKSYPEAEAFYVRALSQPELAPEWQVKLQKRLKVE